MHGAALLLTRNLGRPARPEVRWTGSGEPAALEVLAHALKQHLGRRMRGLAEALERLAGGSSGSMVDCAASLPEVVRWHALQRQSLVDLDPACGRVVDEIVTLRCLVRDVQFVCGHEDAEHHELELAWVMHPEEALEAAISYTRNPALSLANGHVPYVYNVWSSVPGRGDALLRFVARQAGARSIALHPLHEAVAAHYVRAYGAVPVT